eukprot:SAG31_NODE_2465_length_5655_cov_2.338553_8_plen_81_part_00
METCRYGKSLRLVKIDRTEQQPKGRNGKRENELFRKQICSNINNKQLVLVEAIWGVLAPVVHAKISKKKLKLCSREVKSR